MSFLVLIATNKHSGRINQRPRYVRYCRCRIITRCSPNRTARRATCCRCTGCINGRFGCNGRFSRRAAPEICRVLLSDCPSLQKRVVGCKALPLFAATLDHDVCTIIDAAMWHRNFCEMRKIKFATKGRGQSVRGRAQKAYLPSLYSAADVPSCLRHRNLAEARAEPAAAGTIETRRKSSIPAFVFVCLFCWGHNESKQAALVKKVRGEGRYMSILGALPCAKRRCIVCAICTL